MLLNLFLKQQKEGIVISFIPVVHNVTGFS